MVKWTKGIRPFFDYYSNPNRIVKIFKRIIAKFAKLEDWEVINGEDCCILFQISTRTGFRLAWGNYMSRHASITVCCGLFDKECSDPVRLCDARFHQFEDEFQSNEWVWLPRISKDGPTSYVVKYLLSQRKYRWKITRVGWGNDAPYTNNKTAQEIVDELFSVLNNDFGVYSGKLEGLLS